MAIDIDPRKIERLLTRGVETVYPTKEFLEKRLKSGERLKIYLGVDPTGPLLHVGHAIPLRKLREFQDLGHEVILLVGDFTARIGDPSGKSATRKPLSVSQVKKNFASYKKQAGKILKFGMFGGATVKMNGSWLDKLSMKEFFTVLSQFTVPQLMERDMFQERMKNNGEIYAHEFMYPVLQGYDSIAMGVDGELGGNDQTFNMLAGRTLMKKMTGKEKFVLTTKLLTDSSGTKMGKTEGNMVTLTDSPEDMFGKIMSWADGLIAGGFELCTDLPVPSAEEIAQDPKGVKMKLAHEIVRMYCGESQALRAQEKWVSTFSKGEVPSEMEEVSAQTGDILSEVLLRVKIIASKSDFRRLVSEHAVTDLDTNEKITDEKYVVTKPVRLRIGKKRFVKISIQ